MENKTVTNPDQLSDLVAKAMEESVPPVEPAKITAPFDGLVNLPGGYVTFAGEVIKTAEVRELLGKDEEALAKVNGYGRLLNTIISRGVVKVGTETADEALLDRLLSGDRDELLLGIYKVTFGQTAELGGYCEGCSEYKPVAIDIDEDIKRKVLLDTVSEKTFIVKGKKDEYTVTLPTGAVQRRLAENDDKNIAELSTILLEQAVLEINSIPVVSKTQILNLPLVDRRKISMEISKRSPGPQFEDIRVKCPECNGEVVVPISLGALFRF